MVARETVRLSSAHPRRIPPPTRAVTIGGNLKAIGVDSHGLGLEVGIRASPHIGED